MEIDEQRTANDYLGMEGALLSSSKTLYSRDNPEHLVAFNGNVCTESGKIWWGDIDCTARAEVLQGLATALGKNVYVLRETDARFKNEAKPLLNRAIAVYNPARTDTP